MSLKQDQCELEQEFNQTWAQLKKEGFQNV